MKEQSQLYEVIDKIITTEDIKNSQEKSDLYQEITTLFERIGETLEKQQQELDSLKQENEKLKKDSDYDFKEYKRVRNGFQKKIDNVKEYVNSPEFIDWHLGVDEGLLRREVILFKLEE